jgi:predicted permease
MNAIRGALHQGARSLLAKPSFTWCVVLLLSLGIGAVTTIFSVVDDVLLQPLPYPEADRLVEIQAGDHSGPTFQRLTTMRSLQSLEGIATDDVIVTGGEAPLRLREAQITAGFFAMFGGRPAVGRLFGTGDFDSDDGVVLSHGTWRTVFGEDRGVVGRSFLVNDVPRVVVGVLDASFVPPEALHAGGADLWRPLDWSREDLRDEGYSLLSVAARLSPGATVATAQAEADALSIARAELLPQLFSLADGRPLPLPVTPLKEATVGGARRGLGLVFGAVALLLLVACANVAHLFLARGVERMAEMSMRRALGADASLLALQISVESVVLGLLGALVGTGIATGGIAAFHGLGQGLLPRMGAIAVDLRALAFAATAGVLTSLAFGLLPALRLMLRRGDALLLPVSRGITPTRRAGAMRNGLVVAEVAVCLMLTVLAGWLMRDFAALHATNLGFRTDNVWTLPLTITDIETPADWTRRTQRIRESLSAVAGVRDATFGISLPLQYVGGSHCCWRDSPDFAGDEVEREITMHPVDAAYFEILEVQMLAGRGWSRGEEAGISPSADGAIPAVISEPLAVEVFGDVAAALDAAFTLGDTTHTIVGVVADNRHYGPDQDHGAAAYIPAAAIPYVPGRVHMAVLAEGPQAVSPDALAQAVWRVEPDLPVPVVRAMQDWASAATARARFVSGLFTAFGVASLLLIAAGLAGTLLYTVRLRRRELGIRLALGATAVALEWAVLRRGLALTSAGVAIGGMGAWMCGRLLEGLVAGIDSRDATTFGMSVAVVLIVTLVSSWVPARRAAKTDPLIALHNQ